MKILYSSQRTKEISTMFVTLANLGAVSVLPPLVRSELEGKEVRVHFVESFMILDQPTCWSEEVMCRFSEVQERCYAVSWLTLWRVAQDCALVESLKWLQANKNCQLFYFKRPSESDCSGE